MIASWSVRQRDGENHAGVLFTCGGYSIAGGMQIAETFEFQAAHASLLVSSTSPGSMEKSTWESKRHAIRSLSGFSALGLGPNLNEMMSRRRSHRQTQRFDKRPNLTKKGPVFLPTSGVEITPLP